MTPAPPTRREVAQSKYGAARVNLSLMILLTITNVVMLLCGSNRMMLFSASIPYFAAGFGRESGQPLWFGLGIALAVLLIAAYALCWWFSKKKYHWMTVALVLFAVDTLGMIALYIVFQQLLSIWDILLHAWVMFDLIKGVINAHKLKAMADDPLADWWDDM